MSSFVLLMHSNLEHIPLEEVVSEKGIRYVEFRQQLKPDYKMVLVDIGKGYLFLLLVSVALILGFSKYPAAWWILFPGALLIGYIMSYLALFIHEAGHYNIHADKKTNDRLATLWLCLPFGLSLKSYRKIHWQHHVHLGTPEDLEISYFRPLNSLFFLESLTGIHLLRTLRSKSRKGILTREQEKESKVMLVWGGLLHLSLIIASFATGHWPFAIAWIAGFGIFFPLFAALRQVLEHRDERASSKTDYTRTPHGKTSRLFINTVLSSSFGSAGFTRHMIHHWDPQISYTRLKEVENFLSGCEKTRDIIANSKTTYTRTLKKLISSS